MNHVIEVGDYMLDDAVNDATRIWRDVLAAFGHAQEGQETDVRLGGVLVARVVPASEEAHEPVVPVVTRREYRRPRWSSWRGPFQDIFS